MLRNIDGLSSEVVLDTLKFLPELLLCAAIVLLLLLKLLPAFRRAHVGWPTLLLTLAAVGASVLQWNGIGEFMKAPDATGDAFFDLEGAKSMGEATVPTQNGRAQAFFSLPASVGEASIGVAFVRDGALEYATQRLSVDGAGHGVF